MENWTDDEIKGKIITKLSRLRKYRHSHTALDNLQKGFPWDMRGYVKKIAEELINKRILLLKCTNYGKEVSLNDQQLEKMGYYIDCYNAKIE